MALKLIVEAGSTKTESVLVTNSHKVYAIKKSSGINPVTDSNYHHAVKDLAKAYENQDINEILYYGSGCINATVNDKLAQKLRSLFNSETIHVHDDLIAVARGLCQRNPGIVGILGTGSNIGFYDGQRISDGINSCGYLLGDEGSGYRIGQAIYKRFARRQLPPEVQDLITSKFDLRIEDSVVNLYNQLNPRQYLASFAIVAPHLSNVLRSEILEEVFNPYIQYMVLPMWHKYKKPLHLIGSIAVHFEDELKDKLKKFNIIAASIESSPLNGLIRYHSYE